MKVEKFKFEALIVKSALCLVIAGAACVAVPPAFAQGNPTVSVVHLQVQPGNNGQQMVVTPRGVLVPLPGAGVTSNVIDVYMGNSGGYWYVDRNGQTEDLTGYVQQMQARAGQMQTAAPPQYMPYPASTTTNTTNNYNTGSSGSSAAGTAMAAGLGAMAGTAMTGLYYHNVPYGTPIYYGANGRPYYTTAEGKNVFVNEDGDVKWNNVYAANNLKTHNQEQKASQAATYKNQNQQQRQQAMSSNQQARQAAYAPAAQQPDYSAQSQRMQQQQQWYQSQLQNKGAHSEAWQQSARGENPFVSQNAGGRFNDERAGAGEAGGRFGGGRFAGGEGGGRIGAGRRRR